MTATTRRSLIVAAAFFVWLRSHARTPLLRTMAEFAEQEIVLPSGPDEDFRLSLDRQPFNRLWFEEIESGRWSRFAAVGPTQTGKTLIAFVIVILYYLFEVGESVVVGVPDMNMSADKWREDILPVLERTRYRDLIPDMGAGSKGGGKINAIKFKNGATLKFMSAGGGDKSRAGFSARILVVTEVDGFDESSATSRETNKIEQLEGRLRSHGSNRLTFVECTASIAKGKIWQEYTKGSRARIMIRCQHCKSRVHPEREHLNGWQDAESDVEAKENAKFYCPECGEEWSEADRLAANQDAILLHRGQELDEHGNVVGDLPKTETLGFRWSPPNNMFMTAGDIGQDEWNAARAEDEDDAAKKMHQFVWALPWDPEVDLVELDPEDIEKRIGPNRKGIVPDGTKWLTIALDLGLGKRSWWMVMAWLEDGRRHIVQYGYLDIPSNAKEKDAQRVLRDALDEFHGIVLSGWYTATGEKVIPKQAWIDSRYHGPLVRNFCKKAGNRFRPIMGQGESQHMGARYRKPNKVTADVRFLGEEYHAVRRESNWTFMLNSDYYKLRFQEGLKADQAAPGAITLYESQNRHEHRTITRHFAAEKPEMKPRPGKTPKLTWNIVSRVNHGLDCGMINMACGHFVAAETKRQAETAGKDWWGTQNERRGRR